MPAISLLVAVYNTSQYVEQCLQSIADQSFSNIEVILINDGSTDHSGELLEAFAARDERFRVIHQANQGLGAVRNRGIEEAKGTYLAFIDSDDMLAPHYCEALYEKAEMTGADLVVSEYWIQFEQSNRTIPTTLLAHQKAERASLIESLLHGDITGFSWNKLYRRAFIEEHQIRFPLRGELENIEDQYVTLRCFSLSRVMAFVHEPLYYYRVHRSSIVQRYQKQYFHHGLAFYDTQRLFLKEHDELTPYEKAFHVFMVNHTLHCMLNEWKSQNSLSFQEKLDHMREMVTHEAFQHAVKHVEASKLTVRKRMILFLAKLQWIYPLSAAASSYQKWIEYQTRKSG
ncbi:glycosyl transferase [Bacillus xiamenensis]|uniref:Glycosyl transferase n=1 Tax=Bacillus xiamenensis TaxID=1178537 RepID=A0AAC9IIC3_9BACI|nr:MULTISPECIES: glycosyltransferase [Bacillus]AOZ89237.1 glycosyl transferase [Bacillus xiamenensis]MCW1835193.1 glycosyltransferase [Bacillus xiamenensis]QGX64677.1 glycosyltransferase [Bacillus sp. ms-22]